MRISSFRIENFRNLRLAECSAVPDMMVICGGNGCGKSALLEALITAKEYVGQYGSFYFDPSVVSADSNKSTIAMTLAFSEDERAYVKNQFGEDLPASGEIVVDINKRVGGAVRKNIPHSYRLLGFYSSEQPLLGFFEYISARRIINKNRLQNWDAGAISDNLSRASLSQSDQKFQNTKQYLAMLKMQDLQSIQNAIRSGELADFDSLKEIRKLFNRFFAPLAFKDVYLDRSPFGFVVSAPLGEIDIDDLSSGEKEILNLFIRLHQLKPHRSIILFDEADAHLHPDLERRYFEELRSLVAGNQMLLTTHSPEMMIAAGSDLLYTIQREPPVDGGNQFVRVTGSDHLHDVLAELMGSRGLVSFNQRIIFIEGENASADRSIYEAFYPPAKHNVSFVPTGDSSTVRKTAERVNELLSASVGFQEYFSIVDRDIERAEADPTGGKRFFRLPVYHVENFLIDEAEILVVTSTMLGSKCPYKNSDEVKNELERLVLTPPHLKPFARAVLDSKIAMAAKKAYDAIFKKTPLTEWPTFDFEQVEPEAKLLLENSLAQGTWRQDCKGRELLKAYCGIHGLNYEHFRNSLIAQLEAPPVQLDAIMQQILHTHSSVGKTSSAATP